MPRSPRLQQPKLQWCLVDDAAFPHLRERPDPNLYDFIAEIVWFGPWPGT